VDDGWIYPGIRPLEEFASVEEGAVVRFAEHFASTLTIAPLVILVLSVVGLAPAIAPDASKQASRVGSHFGWWILGLIRRAWSGVQRNLPTPFSSAAPAKKDALPVDAEAAAVAAANDICRPKPRSGAGAELKWFGGNKGPKKGKREKPGRRR